MTLKKRLLIVWVLLVANFLSLAVGGIAGLSGIRGESERAHDETIVGHTKALEFKTYVVQIQQWLTDISATRGLDGLNDGYDEAEDNYNKAKENLDAMRSIFKLSDSEYSDISEALDSYYEVGRKMAADYISEGPSLGNKTMGEFDEAAVVMADRVNGILDRANREINLSYDAQSSLAGNIMAFLVLCSVIGVAALILSFVFVSRSMIVFDRVREESERLAAGNISGSDIPADGSDEASAVARALNNMKGGLADLAREMKTNAKSLTSVSLGLREVAEELNESADSQLSEASQVAAAMNELAASNREISSNAVSASDAVDRIKSGTECGVRDAKLSAFQISGMSSSMSSVSAIVKDLEVESESISSVVDVIKGISEQTNLLALNAAIEAARAGEQGRGFAVVADEVRTLAQRTQESTEEIRKMIERLQEKSRNAAGGVDSVRNSVDSAINAAQKVERSFVEINDEIKKLNDMNSMVATASEQQTAVVSELEKAIIGIKDSAEHVVEDVRRIVESEKRIESMSAAAAEMSNRFKL